jgi:hypothetical protein
LLDNDRLCSIKIDHAARLIVTLKVAQWNNRKTHPRTRKPTKILSRIKLVFRADNYSIRRNTRHAGIPFLQHLHLEWTPASSTSSVASLDFSTLEFAAVWKALPKVVFSTTL